MLSDDDLDSLADDIKTNGLRTPIVITAAGVLVDGRNRLAACKLAKVTPTFEVLPDDVDPLDYILSVNVERRHLSTGARAMARAMSLQMQGKREDGRWSRDAIGNISDSEGSWRRAMSQSGVVLDETPEAAWSVMTGDRTLAEAYRVAAEFRDQKRGISAEEKRLQRDKDWLRKHGPELIELVESGKLELPRAVEMIRAEQQARRDSIAQANDFLGRVLDWLGAYADHPENAERLIETFDYHDTNYRHAVTGEDVARAITGLTTIASLWIGEK